MVVSPATSRRWHEPSKTALCDEDCLLDSPYVQTLEPAFKALSHKTSTATLSDFSYQQVAMVLSRACETLRTGHLTLYQLRHSGVSVNIAKKVETIVPRLGAEAARRSPSPCTGACTPADGPRTKLDSVQAKEPVRELRSTPDSKYPGGATSGEPSHRQSSNESQQPDFTETRVVEAAAVQSAFDDARLVRGRCVRWEC